MIHNEQNPIGVFDSGVGGLTVLRSLEKLLPSENFIYFGDTARVPYGNKSDSTVMRYSFENALFLLRKGAKLLVIACNSATSVAFPELDNYFKIPVIGVIKPGAKAAVNASRGGGIGVIGTAATIRSGAYQQSIAELDSSLSITPISCPLFVPLAEEGWQDDEICLSIAKRYLSPVIGSSIDTLVLGCTHYPLLADVIQRAVGPSVVLVDSADTAAIEVKAVLASNGLLNSSLKKGSLSFFLSDFQEHFMEIGERILGRPLERPEVTATDL
jgi:glutamate racemase